MPRPPLAHRAKTEGESPGLPGEEGRAGLQTPSTPRPSPMTMRRCLRRVSASFLVSSTFWVDFFTSPCGFFENILPPPRPDSGPPLPARSKRRKVEGVGGEETSASGSFAPQPCGPSAVELPPDQGQGRHLHPTRATCEHPSPLAQWRLLFQYCTEDGDPGASPAAAAARRHRPGPGTQDP